MYIYAVILVSTHRGHMIDKNPHEPARNTSRIRLLSLKHAKFQF